MRLRSLVPPEYVPMLTKLRRTLLGSASKRSRRKNGWGEDVWVADVSYSSSHALQCEVDAA